jgi:hypothetical protein
VLLHALEVLADPHRAAAAGFPRSLVSADAIRRRAWVSVERKRREDGTNKWAAKSYMCQNGPPAHIT